MTSSNRHKKSNQKRTWTIVLILLAIGASLWFAKPLDVSRKAETSKPAAQSTEWALEPEGTAVPVTLPDTPLRNVPVEPQEAEKK